MIELGRRHYGNGLLNESVNAFEQAAEALKCIKEKIDSDLQQIQTIDSQVSFLRQAIIAKGEQERAQQQKELERTRQEASVGRQLGSLQLASAQPSSMGMYGTTAVSRSTIELASPPEFNDIDAGNSMQL